MVVVIADLIGLGWLLIFCFKPLVNLRGQTGARNELTQHQDPVYLDNFPELSGLDGYTILLIQQRIGHVEGPWDQDQLPIVLLEDNREGLRHSDIPQSLFQGKAGSHRSSLVPEQQGAAGYDKAESHQGGEPRSLQLPPLQWQKLNLKFDLKQILSHQWRPVVFREACIKESRHIRVLSSIHQLCNFSIGCHVRTAFTLQ